MEWRARPVFVSGTFRDMHEERDLLAARAFPELGEKLADYFTVLERVDLRVGVETRAVSDDHAKQELVLRVCLEDVKRCRPFLIVLVGDRYLKACDARERELRDRDRRLIGRAFVAPAERAASEGRLGAAVRLAVAGAVLAPDPDLSHVPELWRATARALFEGRERAVLHHEDPLWAASFSPDGARIVTASGRTARVWDAATGAEVARLGHANPVTAASFGPAGARIVTASGDKMARVWDVAHTAALSFGVPAVLLAATAAGVGALTHGERTDLLLQDAPDDLFAALNALQPVSAAAAAAAAAALRGPRHPNTYLSPPSSRPASAGRFLLPIPLPLLPLLLRRRARLRRLSRRVWLPRSPNPRVRARKPNPSAPPPRSASLPRRRPAASASYPRSCWPGRCFYSAARPRSSSRASSSAPCSDCRAARLGPRVVDAVPDGRVSFVPCRHASSVHSARIHLVRDRRRLRPLAGPRERAENFVLAYSTGTAC